MPQLITTKVLGAEEIVAHLLALGPKFFRKAARAGVTECSRIVLAAAKANLNVKRTGSLYKALGRKVVAVKGGRGYVAVVGPRKDDSAKAAMKKRLEFKRGQRKKQPGTKFRRVVTLPNGETMTVDPVKYAHLIEYGRAEVVPTKKGALSWVLPSGVRIFRKRVKAVPPQPFMRPAWSSTAERCRAIIRAAFVAAVAMARRAGRR